MDCYRKIMKFEILEKQKNDKCFEITNSKECLKKIKLEKLSKDSFAPFGCFYDMANPDGSAEIGNFHAFYPDRLPVKFNEEIAFSPLVVKKLKEYKVATIEYHENTPEIILPITDDAIIHVALPSKEAPTAEQTKAFLVPKNTMVKLNPCVWHYAPLPANLESVTVIIGLPLLTYKNNCIVAKLNQDQQFIIEK